MLLADEGIERTAEWLSAGLVFAATIAVLAAAGRWGSPVRRTAVLAAAAALTWALEATFLKTATQTLATSGIGGMLTHWPLYAFIAATVTGTLLQQATLHVGPLSVSQPADAVIVAASIATTCWNVIHQQLRRMERSVVVLDVVGSNPIARTIARAATGMGSSQSARPWSSRPRPPRSRRSPAGHSPPSGAVHQRPPEIREASEHRRCGRARLTHTPAPRASRVSQPAMMGAGVLAGLGGPGGAGAWAACIWWMVWASRVWREDDGEPAVAFAGDASRDRRSPDLIRGR